MNEENQARRNFLLPLRFELGAAAIEEVTKLSEALERLLVAIRKDIGVDTDGDTQRFLRAARIDVQRMRGMYDTFVDDLVKSNEKD